MRLNKFDDGFFFDDQYKKDIQQLIENEYKILNITDNGPLDYTPEYQIPKDKFFFMGDNRDNSSDSRIWGFVPRENFMGTAEVIWATWECWLCLPSFERAGKIK